VVVAGALVFGLIALVRSASAPKKGVVQITLKPTAVGARVSLDGREYSRNDLTRPLEFFVGVHQLSATRPGCQPLQASFEVREGENQPLTFTFLPDLAAAPNPSALFNGAPGAAGAPPGAPGLAGFGSLIPPNASIPRTIAPPPATGPTRVSRIAPAPPIDYQSPPVPVNPDAKLTTVEGGRHASAKGAIPLSRIVNSPAEFADRLVKPAGLVVLGTSVRVRVDQLKSIAMADHEGVYDDLQVDYDKLNLVIDDTVAETIARLAQVGKIHPSHPVINHRRSTTDLGYPAIATVKVQQVRWRNREYWVGTIVRLEMCVEMDPLRVGAKKFQKAFHTMSIDGAQVADGFGDGDEWADRVGPEFVRALVAQYKRLQAMNNAQRNAFLASQYYGLMSQGAGMAAQSGAAQSAAVRDAMRGR
jgi:hypothetical protein